MARLDRLAAAKLVAQLGAAIGRTFAYDLVQAVAPLDAATLQGRWRSWSRRRSSRSEACHPRPRTFKHALIQDAAYQSLLRSTRQQYHQRIAQVLEERFPETAEDATGIAGPSLYGGGSAQAVATGSKPGRARQSSARPTWKPSHLHKGWETPHGSRTRRSAPEELDLKLALGWLVGLGRGYAGLEAEQPIPGREPCAIKWGHPAAARTGAEGSVVISIWGGSSTPLGTGGAAPHLASVPDPDGWHWPLHVQGITSGSSGRVLPPAPHLRKALASYEHVYRNGFQPVVPQASLEVYCLCYMALVYGCWAIPTRPWHGGQEGADIGAEMAHPFTLAVALHSNGQLHYLRRTSISQY